MITKNLKVFFVYLAVSIPIWWGVALLSEDLEEFFLLYELRTDPKIIAAFAAQRDLDQRIQDTYPLAKKGRTQLQLPARSVLALYIKEDGTTKVLLKKDSEIILPIASITKLMTALVAMKNYPPEERITITPAILETPGEAGQLSQGDVLTVRDLLYLALMESSNDAAVALTEPLGLETFVSLMNKEAVLLNLPNTIFKNPTGLDIPKGSNLSNTTDLAKLTRYLLDNYSQVFDILSQSELALIAPDGIFHHNMQNTNKLLGYYAWPAKILGGKTGTTNQARETLLFVVESPTSQGYIINVILGSEDRFEETKQLLQWILNSYQWKA